METITSKDLDQELVSPKGKDCMNKLLRHLFQLAVGLGPGRVWNLHLCTEHAECTNSAYSQINHPDYTSETAPQGSTVGSAHMEGGPLYRTHWPEQSNET